jgi:ComF family protein
LVAGWRVGERWEQLRLLVLDLLYPPKCGGCEKAGAWLCDSCRASMAKPADHGWRCANCWLQLVAYSGVLSCPLDCQSEGLTGLLGVSSYTSQLPKLIPNMKYQGWQVLAPVLAGLMLAELRDANDEAEPWPLETIPSLVAVPAYPKRKRYRGFNQADLLAAELSTQLGWPLLTGLRRIRDTEQQSRISGDDYAARAENVRGAFAWRDTAPPPNTVILVDDVFTSGSTIRECATTLRRAGSKAVYALVLALASDRSTGGNKAANELKA